MKKNSIKRAQSQAGLSFAERLRVGEPCSGMGENFRPQVKQRILSLLVLLMTAATGAWADTTVTWTASDMSGIYIDFLDGEAYNNTIKGITVTSSGGGGAGASWEGTGIDLNSGSTTITFTSSVGNIKSIAITAENIEMSSIPSGWTTDYSTLSWSGEASTTVPLPLSGWTEISGISEIVFTIESTVNVTGITLDKTEASMIVGGETLTLTPTVAPGNATDKSVTWSSSNEAVATVANGVVTAVAPGTATITATATNGTADTSDDKTATCTVTVSPAGYGVALKSGTEDAASWQGKAGTGDYQSLPLTGVEAGTAVSVKYFGTKKVESVKAVKKANPYANAKLGDLFYSDGTFSSTLEAGKTPIGVIAYLGTDAFSENGTTVGGSPFVGHGLVLCLKNATSEVAWSTEKVSKFSGQEVTSVDGLKRTENVSGYTNTATLTVDEATAAKYPAAAAAKNYTELSAPAGTTGWFLPSAQQWVKMIEGLGGLTDGAPNFGESFFDNNHTAADKWEAALSEAGNGNYDSMKSKFLWYWSSSECSADNAVYLSVDATATGDYYGFWWDNDDKGNAGSRSRVRPVLAF